MLSFIVTVLFIACRHDNVSINRNQELSYKAMVVSARQEASEIGVEIMKAGGNGFDAMVATHFALAVCYPYAGNLGGGGFMVYRLENSDYGCLDFREVAPQAATRDMYLDEDNNYIENSSVLGGLAAGIPGSVMGILTAHKKYGLLPLAKLIEPAIKLARNGVIVTDYQARMLNKYSGKMKSYHVKSPLLKEGEWYARDTIFQPELATTLEMIASHGTEAFYKGEMAQKLVETVNQHGGVFSLEDLASYKCLWREPVLSNYHNFKIISMSLPSSGGICLVQILNMLEDFAIDSLQHNSSEYIQLLVEAERRAYADRAHWLGDEDFVEVPVKRLMDECYSRERMSDFRWNIAGSSDSVSHGVLMESDETTHYSIVDQFGNAISVTTTINGAYGSGLYIPELGFLMNNEMDDFSAKPGQANMYGLVGNEANAIAPGKRMLSSMTPTIVEKNDSLYMVLGTPGGSTIITSVLQTILNVVEYDMTIQQAVDAPRFHHQWLPDEILLEPNKFDNTIIRELHDKGYRTMIRENKILGKIDAILVDSLGNLHGGADRRGDDYAEGWIE